MKYLFFFVACSIASILSAKGQSIDVPQQEKGEFLMMAVYKSNQSYEDKSKIVISDGEEVKEVTKLEGFMESQDLKAITRTLNAVKNKGYRLVNTNGGGGSGSSRVAIFTYLFQKK